MGKNNEQGEKCGKYREWVEFGQGQVSATSDFINKCIHIKGVAQDHVGNGE